MHFPMYILIMVQFRPFVRCSHPHDFLTKLVGYSSTPPLKRLLQHPLPYQGGIFFHSSPQTLRLFSFDIVSLYLTQGQTPKKLSRANLIYPH